MPNLQDEVLMNNIIQFIQHDLIKLKSIYEMYKNKNCILNNEIIQNIFQVKSYNDDTKKITQKLINNHYSMNDHLSIMNETDRTIVGLLWHENIIDTLGKMPKAASVPFYLKMLL